MSSNYGLHVNYIIIFGVSFFVVVICLKILLWILRWYLKKKYSIKTSIASPLKLRGILVQFSNGFSVEIESVCFTSCLFNSKHKCFFGITLNDVRLQGDTVEMGNTANKESEELMLMTHIADSQSIKNIFEKLNRMSWLRVFSVYITNFSFMQLGLNSVNFSDKYLLNTTVQEFTLHFESTKKKSINLNLVAASVCLQLLKHGAEESCLAQASSSVVLKFICDHKGFLENAVSISQLQINVYDSLPFSVKSRDSSLSTRSAVTQEVSLWDSFKLVPLRKCLVHLQSSSVNLIKEQGKRALKLELSETELQLVKASNDDVEVKFCFSEVISSSDNTQFLCLNKFVLITKAEQENTLNLSLKVFFVSEITSCHLNLDDKEIQYWLRSFGLFSRQKITNDRHSRGYKWSQMKEKLYKGGHIKFGFSSDLNSLSLSMSGQKDTLTCNLVHAKINSMVEPDPLLGEFSYEFLIDALTCESGVVDENRKHNEIISIKSLIFKLHYETFSEIRINCASDTTSIDLDYLLSFLDSYVTEHIKSDENIGAEKMKEPARYSVTHIAFNSTSTSFLSNKLKLQFGIANIDSDSTKFASVIRDASITSLVPLLKDESLPLAKKILNVSQIKLVFNHDTNERTVTFSEEIFFMWNVYFHMSVASLVNDFKKKLKPMFSRTDSPSKAKSSKLFFGFDGNVNIGALLSNENQSANFALSSLEVTSSTETLEVKINSTKIIFVGNEIGQVDRFTVVTLNEDDSCKLLNRKNVGLRLNLKKNRLVVVTIENVRVVFPYLYNFAETFNERLVTIIKWIKGRKERRSIDEKVSADIILKINNAVMEVNDDPFEVKLRDNYELLEDEFREGLKRSKVLQERLQQRNVIYASSKLKELKTALDAKQAEIYIKRHRQLYKSVPMRSRLFFIEANSIDINIFADSTLTGYDQLVRVMRNVDKESPFPDDIGFSSLWGRQIQAHFQSFTCGLRDFPKPMFNIKDAYLEGLILGAEQEATARAFRTCFIDTLPSFPPLVIERSMTTLKLYHDINAKANCIAYTHGVCWEPVLQQVNICFESIIKPSKDPSPSLTWWDRMRFLFHGPLRVSSETLSLIFHSSLNPYNTSELIEICFTKSLVEWLTGRIHVKGNLDLLIHTASKYDECRIVHLPNIRITIQLQWDCLSNQYDHHSVVPCAADKIPDYSSHQIHDSYRAFRSHNLNAMVLIESDQQTLEKATDIPTILLYSSTLRWFESQKLIFSGMARLTRRGKLFGNLKPRKVPFLRIFKRIRVTLSLHKIKVSYWSSFSKVMGCEITGKNLHHCAEHSVSLIPFNDGLERRSRVLWEMAYMNSEICDVEMWLFGPKKYTKLDDVEEDEMNNCRMYFLSLSRVSYSREKGSNNLTLTESQDQNTPNHRLVLHDLRGAWTKDNRYVVISLFDLYMKVGQLKKNLSTDALKAFKIDGQAGGMSSPVKGAFHQHHSKSSPASTMNKGHAASMLQKLIAESEANTNVVYTEDIESEIGNDEPKLKGVSACSDDDVIQRNWLIELVNSQVMLRGSETSGYVIASAAKTQIWQNIHRPVWKERTLYSKTTWVGSVECMQYYGTVEGGHSSDDNVLWLNVDNIEEKSSMCVNDIPDLVGSGRSAGGVVTAVVGTSDSNDYFGGTSPIQLQRIISRCGCKFFYVNYTEGFDEDIPDAIPPLPEENDLLLLEPWDSEVAVDSFTLTHDDLDVSTNSQQFAMIMDLVNNLLLYVEPHKKEATEALQRMRFKFQLSSTEDQKEPILQFQDHLRSLVAHLNELERESYVIQKTLEDQSPSDQTSTIELCNEAVEIETQIEIYQDKVNKASDELAQMISCYKEAQISADKTRERQLAAEEGGGAFIASVVRRIEVCFKQASWRLTDSDGQLGLSDIVLNNFLYTKVAKNDDSVEHTVQLGNIYVLNLLPNPVYKTILQPTELKPNIPLDRHYALRVFCRDMAPVGGISVKEHFEVNVIPLTICITFAFFKSMLKFFFPERVSDGNASVDNQSENLAKSKKNKKLQKDDSVSSENSSAVSSAPNIPVTVLKGIKGDDIEKMRERALRNQTFVYIKIPEVPIRVSYRGRKEKSIMNITNFSLILPTIEYHNFTWTWLDLLMAIKNESKNRLLSQAVKQKLQIKPNFLSSSHAVEEEDDICKDVLPKKEEEEHKARLLLGDLALGGHKKAKRSLFGHRK